MLIHQGEHEEFGRDKRDSSGESKLRALRRSRLGLYQYKRSLTSALGSDGYQTCQPLWKPFMMPYEYYGSPVDGSAARPYRSRTKQAQASRHQPLTLSQLSNHHSAPASAMNKSRRGTHTRHRPILQYLSYRSSVYLLNLVRKFVCARYHRLQG